tara:strand:+ start:875 stop:1057 length:183 start_codon:yes stop_codon:yes gene_type:complete
MDSENIQKILIKLLDKFNKNPNYVPTEEEKTAFNNAVWDEEWCESSSDEEEEEEVGKKKI